MDVGRSRLIRLGEDEIKQLLEAFSTLPIMWAKPARVSKKALEDAQPRTLRAVRTGLAQHVDPFLSGLAWSAMVSLAGEHDLDADPNGPDSDESAELLAEGAGAQLGPDIGTFVIHVIAESDLPLAARVRENLDHLVAIATDAGSTSKAELEDLPRLDADADGVEVPEPEANISNARDPEPADATPVPSSSAAASEMLDEVLQLLEITPALSASLRTLATEIEAGRAPNQENAECLPRASEWVARATLATGGSADLYAVADAIRSGIDQQNARRAELEGLLHAVETLESQGHAKYATGLLTQHDFPLIDDLRNAIASIGRPGGGPDSESTHLQAPVTTEVATQSPNEPFAESNETATDSESEEISPEGEASLLESATLAEEPLRSTLGDVDPASAPILDESLAELSASDPIPTGSSATSDVAETASHGGIDAPDDNDAPASATSPLTDRAETSEAAEVLSSFPVDVDETAIAARPDLADPDEQLPPSDAWTDGRIAALISTRRDPLAILSAEAFGVGPQRVKMLRLFTGAFNSRSDVLLSQDPALIVEEGESELSTDENRVLFAAHSRLALELGFSPVGSLDRFRQGAALDGHPAGDFANEIVRLVTRGFKRPLGTASVTALPDDWMSYADALDHSLESLQSIRISYQRATRIIHHLARANQAIGGLLTHCAMLARRAAGGDLPCADDWAEVEKLAIKLRDDQYIERLLSSTDRALSTPQQLRNPIVASARDRLHSALSEVAELVEEGLSLRARAEGSGSDNDPQEMAGLVALAGRLEALPEGTVGAATIHRLVDWVQADAVAAAPSLTLGQLLLDEMLPLYEIDRDSSGATRRTLPTPCEVETLIEGRDAVVVFRGYLDSGNVRAAEQALTRYGLPRTPSVEDEIAEATQRHSRRQRELVSDVDRVIDRLRSLFDADLVRTLSQELDEHREMSPGRFDLHLGPLKEIQDRGEAQLGDVRAGLQERAHALPDRKDSTRILQLLESRDEQLAVDYLTLAEAGEPLPALTPPAGDDFGEFFPQVVLAAASANRQRAIDNINEVRKLLGSTSSPSNRMLSQGLKAWTELVLDRHARQMTEGRLAHVLRMLGLIPADQRWIKELTKARHAGYATYAVKASPIDRSYVPGFGTQAHGEYDVTIVWDDASPQRLLQFVETNRRTQANVILYLGTIGVEQRLELRKLTNRPGFAFSPIVIDMPVIAWLSARSEPAWRLTQRVTLPFTTLNPYTPFAGGEVPDEVFVGRDAERREIIDPTGSMFVYGGRQLGKSALLRRVEREIMRVRDSSDDSFEHGHVAVYLDLKSEGIGESSSPSALWDAIAPRLVKAGVLAATSGSWTADSVTVGVLDWLEADASRRLILLLDEADNFLTLDARDTGPTQVGGFPVLQRLKGVMERTGRRFKPVFAGLHQVQRFHGLPNTPVVHGGQDILIGPLKPVDARELVRDPLYALGYEFETPDTMWRLLRFTNYQASLIQIICEALVRHMKAKPLPPEGGRVVITARDVDDVYAKREVRDLIAQRFRWTINLDNRYRVIALVTALRSLDSRPGERFRSTDLHDECEYYWAAGFARSTLSSGEFFRYLNEMQGLGVLQRQGDEFGLRSPSILGLLGSRETIETELLEASDQLEVDYQYNPTMNRRVLTQEATGEETRSPLPDSELASLLSHEKGEPRVKVVAGTMALGLDRVKDALHRAAKDRRVRLVDVDPYTLRDQIAGDDGTHLLLDLCAEDEPTRRSALGILAESRESFVTVVLPADDVPLDSERSTWPVVNLRRWSLEGLQSWHDSPFPRHELRDTTGGWPGLVEKAVSLVMLGASTESALQSVTLALHDPVSAAEFLGAARVPLEYASLWLEWFGSDGDDGSIGLAPASLDDLNTAFGAGAGEIIERLQLLDVVDESSGGWVLDRVVARATRTTQA